MADKKPKPHGYHPITDNQWVLSVSKEAVEEMLNHAHSATVEHKDAPARLTPEQVTILEGNRNFLTRAMRGFVLEFLRQTAERMTDLNYDSQTPEKEIAQKANAGLFHAKSCVKGLMQRGMDIDSATYSMGICIRHAIDTFTERYNEHEELIKSGDPMSSILFREGEIRMALKKDAQNWKNSAKTPSA